MSAEQVEPPEHPTAAERLRLAPPLGQPTAATLYERSLLASAAGQAGRGTYRVRFADGSSEALDLLRWIGAADAADRALLTHARGPVIDVGCGPGRHVAALREAGIAALGLDVAAAAVALTRRRGAPALHGSVFGDIPGRWATALLLDGNIGIGGDPVALLRRVRELLVPGGRVLVELDPPGTRSGPLRLRLEGPGEASAWFRWARLAAPDVAAVATRAELRLDASWDLDGRRWLACLVRD